MKKLGIVLLALGILVAAGAAPSRGEGGNEKTPMVAIGDGTTSQGDVNGKSLPLADALKRLPPQGGRIMILAGEYVVSNVTVVSASRVSIIGVGAASRIKVRSGEGDVDFLNVEEAAEGFSLRELNVEWAPADGERSLVRILSPGARVNDCRFLTPPKADLPPASADRKGWASFVSIGPGPDATKAIRGAWLARNEFSAGMFGRGLSVQKCTDVFCASNDFNGNLSGPGVGVYTSNCNQQQYTGNTFVNMGGKDAKDSVGLHVDNKGGDLGHMQVAGNHFHTIFGAGACGFKADRLFFSTISGNVFGRVQGAGASAVRLSQPQGVTVSGNVLENTNPVGDGAVLRVLDGAGGLNIASNTFSDCYETEIAFEAKADQSWRGVSVMSNLFNTHAKPHDFAVVLSGGEVRGMAVTGNTTAAYTSDFPFRIGDEAVTVEGNIVTAPAEKKTTEEPAGGRGAASRPAGR